jgi:site-specific recombinase XerD
MLETLTRPVLWGLPVSAEALELEYAAYRRAAGYASDDPVRLWGARAFLRRYPDLESWRTAPLDEQLGLPRSLNSFAHFLFLKFYLRPTMGYLLSARPLLAKAAKRCLYPQVFARFYELGRRLGYADSVLSHGTLNFLFYVITYAGQPVEHLTPEDLQAFEQALRAYQPVPGDAYSPRSGSAHLYQVRMLLYHAGILPAGPPRYNPSPALALAQRWVKVPGPLQQVVLRYLTQLRTVRAPETVNNNEGYLRRFFVWLAEQYPGVRSLRKITRPQIEAFKYWLCNAVCETGKPYHRHTVGATLSALRCFFQTVREWDWPEAPERQLVFAQDLPIPDQPLPRFLDDPQAAALLQAARASTDLFTRVCVETLLRTGLRKGEFVRLQLNSMVQIGDTFWLRVPLGKLHTDRYVPLHPEVKSLLDEWIAQRGAGLPTNDLFLGHGRRVSLGRVDSAVKRAALAAGLEHVSPHRLRHTLATQAINRGMSLEAIAALLGHRSLTMTAVYARIANKTVREQYFSVCDSLDELYTEAVLGNQATPAAKDNGSLHS